MFETFEPVDADDTVCGDVLRVLFYPRKKFLSGHESRKSLWLSDMTSVFIFVIVHSESLRQKMPIHLISRYSISLLNFPPATYCRLWRVWRLTS